MKPAFRSRLHEERAAALLGIALGVSFLTCFLTGLASHVAYAPPSWWPIGPRPAGLYRVTQGVHVVTGIASIPLLLVKLWVVYPHLWVWPPVRSVAHAVERLSLVPLVAGSLFLVFTGAGTVARWRPWGFFFTAAHHDAAWITIGALVVHVAAKATVTRDALRREAAPTDAPTAHAAGMTRRQLLGAAGAASAALTVATVGQTLRPFAGISVLAPRDPRTAPQGIPVNRSAAGAGVAPLLRAPTFERDYRLEVVRRDAVVARLSIDDLRALRATEARLPIACVDGWSADGVWRGVAVRDLLAALAVADADRAIVESFEPRGRYRTSELPAAWLRDHETLLAYDLAGAPLTPDHGAPLRLIAPNRPGVLQTKWVGRVVVT